jgi:hypothetical protein
MLSEDINRMTLAVRAIQRGDKETAALYLQTVKANSRSRHAKRLVYALIDLHNLQPCIEQAIKERREWEERLDRMAAAARAQMGVQP